MSQQFKTLMELFSKYPWRSEAKFIPLAKRYGFTDVIVIKKFLKEQALHDVKIPDPKYLPIYSHSGDAYQMDTLIQKKENPYMIIININTRKAYGYRMNDKGAKSVKLALTKFFEQIPNVKFMTSDQDPAYLSHEVLTFLKSKNVVYRTTEDNDHNVLGIINRFMRTLRDLNDERDFTEEKMNELINEYNNSPHSGIGNVCPNDMDSEKEKEYIKSKEELTLENTYEFNDGDHVRIVLDKNKIGKNRMNLSKEAYIIDGRSGNQFIIKSKDGSVDKYPGFRLIKCDSRYKLAETIKEGKRGVIEEILSYNPKKDKYKVRYDEGTKDSIPSKNLREGNPLKLSFMERQYWLKQKNIPPSIRKWF